MPIGAITAVVHKERALYVTEYSEVGTVVSKKQWPIFKEATEFYLVEFP
jgi:hypothetical protein